MPLRYDSTIGYNGTYFTIGNNLTLLKINGTSHFANDLGLDSLDTVEVVMAIEEVFRYTLLVQAVYIC